MWIFKCLNKNLKTNFSGNIYQSLVPGMVLKGSRNYNGRVVKAQWIYILVGSNPTSGTTGPAFLA